MNLASQRAGWSRLPLRAAAFVVLTCVAILGVSGWREWAARDQVLKGAETEMANVARSLTQHAEDSLDLLDSGVVGVVSRLEMDGADPATIAKLRNLLEARKKAMERVHSLAIIDDQGNWLTSPGTIASTLSDDAFFRHHQLSPKREAFIGHPVKSLLDGEWVVTLSRRFNKPDGSFGGVVLAAIGSQISVAFLRAVRDRPQQLRDADVRRRHDHRAQPEQREIRRPQCRRHAPVPRRQPAAAERRLSFHVAAGRRRARQLLQAQRPLPARAARNRRQGRAARAVAGCCDLPHAVRGRAGDADRGDRRGAGAAVAARPAHGGGPDREGGAFPPARGRLQRHGHPHRARRAAALRFAVVQPRRRLASQSADRHRRARWHPSGGPAAGAGHRRRHEARRHGRSARHLSQRAPAEVRGLAGIDHARHAQGQRQCRRRGRDLARHHRAEEAGDPARDARDRGQPHRACQPPPLRRAAEGGMGARLSRPLQPRPA